jgi:hypothetical protein
MRKRKAAAINHHQPQPGVTRGGTRAADERSVVDFRRIPVL